MTNVKNEPWYADPFGWYEKENRPELLGVQLTDNVALDFLQGLHDIYLSFKDKHYDKAVKDTEVLAKLLIASAYDLGQEVIEELLAEEFDDIDIDKAFQEMVEEDNGKSA